MQTAGEELRFDIEGGSGGLKHDEEFLQDRSLIGKLRVAISVCGLKSV